MCVGSLWFPAALLVAQVSTAHEGHEVAIEILTETIEASSEDVHLYIRRGEIHRENREWKSAEEDYDRAASIDPSLTIVELARARMLFESGQTERARVCLESIAEHHPANVNSLRAEIYLANGESAKAAVALRKAIDHSTDPEPALFLKCARTLHAAGNDTAALATLDEGFAKYGTAPQLQSKAIELEVALGNLQNALDRIGVLEPVMPRKETLQLQRAVILELMGKDADAQVAYKAAKASLQKLPSARRYTAATTAVEQQIDNALERSAAKTALNTK